MQEIEEMKMKQYEEPTMSVLAFAGDVVTLSGMNSNAGDDGGVIEYPQSLTTDVTPTV